jgi:pimeloyl-ACP methyl ester carboxylesterase
LTDQPNFEYDEWTIDGVRVEAYGTASERLPLVLVHGGTQGSWAWENVAPRLAEIGWQALCLNWFNHNGSRNLPEREALTRSIADVSVEIGLVARKLGRTPALVGHSMGALAALAYASRADVAALALITPVVPSAHAGEAIPIPVDFDALWMPPPEMVDQLFWDAVDATSAARYTSLMTPESPKAVFEATRWGLDVDTAGVSAPALVFGADRDLLVPEELVRSLANDLGARYTRLVDQGHGVPLNPAWEGVTAEIDEWLTELAAEEREGSLPFGG